MRKWQLFALTRKSLFEEQYRKYDDESVIVEVDLEPFNNNLTNFINANSSAKTKLSIIYNGKKYMVFKKDLYEYWFA